MPIDDTTSTAESVSTDSASTTEPAPSAMDPARSSRRQASIPVVTLVFFLVALGLSLSFLLGLWPVESGSYGITTLTIASRDHVEGPANYSLEPPAGGDHAGIWQNCGFYSHPVITEQAVHSLEHGAVWITYRPNLAKAQIDQIRILTQGGDHVLASPWAGQLPAPVVASAWGRQILLKSATDPALADFLRIYQSGPQTPEPGATCTNGIGEPE